MNTPESTPSAASPPTITGTTALMQDIAAMVETHATRAVESATKELRKHLADANRGAEINAHVNTALVDKNAAQAAQIAELREQANNWESLAHQNEKERASASAAVIALTRERDALKAEFHRLSLGKDAAAVLDSWTKNYGILKDPALGYLQAGIQAAVENSREGSISNEYEFTRVGEVVFFGIPSMVNERGVKHGLSRSTALRLLGELRVALNFPGEAEADARATKAESDLAALRLLVEKLRGYKPAIEQTIETLADNVPAEHRADSCGRMAHLLNDLAALTPDSCAKEVEELRKDKVRGEARADYLSMFLMAAGGRIIPPGHPVGYGHTMPWALVAGHGNLTRVFGQGETLVAAIDAARGAKEASK